MTRMLHIAKTADILCLTLVSKDNSKVIAFTGILIPKLVYKNVTFI